MDEFLDALSSKVRAKTEKWMEQLEKQGPNLPRPYADSVRDKIRELRIRFGHQQYRVLYFFEGKRIILTHGFLKKSDKVPEEEIERALRSMQDFQNQLKKGDIEL